MQDRTIKRHRLTQVKSVPHRRRRSARRGEAFEGTRARSKQRRQERSRRDNSLQEWACLNVTLAHAKIGGAVTGMGFWA